MVTTRAVADLVADPQRSLRDAIQVQLRRRKPGQPIEVRLDDPALLYLTAEQAVRYRAATENSVFETHLFAPLRQLFGRVAADLCGGLLPPVDFIDLGPGFPDKSLPLVASIRSTTPLLRYIPVDLNEAFLTLSASVAIAEGYEAHPVRALFNELPSVLEDSTRFPPENSRVFNLGITFCNFPPPTILDLFEKLLAGPQHRVGIIATELVDGSSSDEILEPYRSAEAARFNFMLLELVGFDPGDFTYEVTFSDGRISMGFRPRRLLALPHADQGAISTSDHFVTSVSYRYRRKPFHDLLSDRFESVALYESVGLSVARIEGVRNHA